jgi:hypothetical protein
MLSLVKVFQNCGVSSAEAKKMQMKVHAFLFMGMYFYLNFKRQWCSPLIRSSPPNPSRGAPQGAAGGSISLLPPPLPPFLSFRAAVDAGRGGGGPRCKSARGVVGGGDRRWRLGRRPTASACSASRAASLDVRRRLLLHGLRRWMVVAVAVESCARRDPSCGARMVWLRLPPSTEFSFIIVGQRMAAWGHVRLLRV